MNIPVCSGVYVYMCVCVCVASNYQAKIPGVPVCVFTCLEWLRCASIPINSYKDSYNIFSPNLHHILPQKNS